MRFRGVGFPTVIGLAAVGMLLAAAATAQAQIGATAGVVVDAQGVLHTKVYPDPGGQLMRQRKAAARASLSRQVAATSPMRFVSLPRLEQAIVDRGGAATDEMRYLAGLQRMEYVFVYPDSGDIVIAGPAEGWVADPSGRVVGLGNGRPVLQLQDLAVALRAFPPDRRGTPMIGCSIDPTPEGLAAMQKFLRGVRPQPTPQFAQYVAAGLKSHLGLQNVSINGVSSKTRFAQVMVEADYRMKLIGIGLEQPPIRLASYVELTNPATVSRNAMQRWYFVPDYECVHVSDDRLAMRLVGDGVKLVGEDEVVAAGGQRQASGRTSRASQTFVQGFTRKYPELAARSPVYAELRNLIDLAVAAAFIQQEDYYTKADWRMPLLGDENQFAVGGYSIPQTVESAVNAIWKRGTLMTPVGGGVSIHPHMALTPGNLQSDADGQVAQARARVTINLAEGQWWWD